MQPVRTPQRLDVVLAGETVDLIDCKKAVRTDEVGEYHHAERFGGIGFVSHVASCGKWTNV